MRSDTKQKGIGLIEIMVALVVVAIGILGIAQLQTKVVRSASDANARAIAAVLAQKKIDQLRSFNFLSTNNTEFGAGDFAFDEITSESAVTISDALSNTQFQLTTNLVGDYYYGATDFTAATTSGTGTPDFKVVEVLVTWTDIDNSSQQYKVKTVIDGYPPQFSSLKGNSTVGSSPPIIPYTPEAAPDVVPVTLDIGDKKKESSKPVPEVSKKGDSTTVSFETVTYNNIDVVNNLADTVKREDFLTAKCLCRNGPSSNSSQILEGSTTWSEQDLQLEDITDLVSVTPPINDTDVDNSGGELQAAECSICCRDGEDTASGFKSCRLKRIDGVYRIMDEWKMVAFNVIPSSYFNNGDDGDSDDSLAAMDNTKQAANIARYSDYVISVLRNALGTIEAAADRQTAYESLSVDTSFNAYSDVNDYLTDGVDHTQMTVESTSLADILNDISSAITPTSNRRQLQVRAVYLDFPPEGIYESGLYDETDVPLDRVPFFENNFTEVAGWIPDVNVGQDGAGTGDQTFDANYTDNHDDMDGADCVNDDDPVTGRNYVTNEDFFYASGGSTTDCSLIASRGMVYPFVSASQAVNTIMFTGNDGIVDFNVTNASTATDTIIMEINP